MVTYNSQAPTCSYSYPEGAVKVSEDMFAILEKETVFLVEVLHERTYDVVSDVRDYFVEDESHQ